MYFIKNSLKNNKKYFNLLLTLLFLGFFIGFILTKKIDLTPILENIKSLETYLNTNSINFLSSHIIILIILTLSSLTIIGLLLFPLNIIYEGVCIYFNIYIFTKLYKLNGVLYGLIYITITKGIYLILMVIIFKEMLNLLKRIITQKEKSAKRVLITKSIKKIFTYEILIIINDILIYLIGSKLLKIFLILIK